MSKWLCGKGAWHGGCGGSKRIEDLEVAVKSSLRSSRGRPSTGMARGWNKVSGVLATAAVVLAVGLPGGPFGPQMARAAGAESHLSSQPSLTLDASASATVDARPDFIVLGWANKPKGGGGAQGGGSKDSNTVRSNANNGGNGNAGNNGNNNPGGGNNNPGGGNNNPGGGNNNPGGANNNPGDGNN